MAARQRLRTAQVSLLRSLEQVSPNASPSLSPNVIRRDDQAPLPPSSPLAASMTAASVGVASPMAGLSGAAAAAGSGCAAAVIAGKVDNPAARTPLTELGVDYIQGFIVGRPAPLLFELQTQQAASQSTGTHS